MVIAGVVLVGEGVFSSTQSSHFARKLALLDLGGTFEKHVFQHMGHARDAVDLVHGTDPYPQHMHRGRRTFVHFDDERHAVFQGELLSLGGGLRQGRTQGQQQHQPHETQPGVAWKS